MDQPPRGPPEDVVALIEVHKETGPAGSKYTVLTNLKVVPAPLQNELQDILDAARLQLQGIKQVQEFSGRFDDVFMHTDPAENRRLSLPALKEEAAARVTRSAFRDALEAAHHPLEQARRVLAIWAKRHTKPGAEVVLDFEDAAAEFHALGLSAKLDYLKRTFRFTIEPDAVATVRNLYKARNCIVHRFGHVTGLDCEDGKTMVVHWEEYAILTAPTEADFDDSSKVRRVYKGETVEGGQAITIRRLRKTRTYSVGERVILTAQDLSDICNTIYLFAMQVRDDLRAYGANNGIPMETAS